MRNSKFVVSLFFAMTFTGLVIFAMNAGADPTPASHLPHHVALKGKPRLVRGSPRTEVFFTDLPTSYWIDQDLQHNAFQKAFLEAARKGKTLGFTADEDNRKILSVEGVKTQPVSSDVEEILEVKTQK